MDKAEKLRKLLAPVLALDQAAQIMELADSADPAEAEVGRLINDLTCRLDSAVKAAQGTNSKFERVKEFLLAKGYEYLATFPGPNDLSRMHYFTSPAGPPRVVQEYINRGVGEDKVGVEVYGPLTESINLEDMLALL